MVVESQDQEGAESIAKLQDRLRLFTQVVALVLSVCLIAFMAYTVMNIEAMKADPLTYLETATNSACYCINSAFQAK